MEALTEKQIRGSFVNCTKGEATRLKLPADFGQLPWGDLDFLGWTDPGAPLRAHLVLPRADGPVGITLRVPSAGRTSAIKSSMCHVCLTPHASSGVTLFAAPLAGTAGREGNTVGTYLCSDLACSLYIRGRKQPKLRTGVDAETLTEQERIDRTVAHLTAFAEKVLGTR
ncbi:FBP domain-containing protein [Streptomyces sp. NPDC056437]|uniref:FBP domain-containing protein n=1 Tax=Streptomyces sp. NPDC056437 TaxID=3345816 RepID=UPI00369569E6